MSAEERSQKLVDEAESMTDRFRRLRPGAGENRRIADRDEIQVIQLRVLEDVGGAIRVTHLFPELRGLPRDPLSPDEMDDGHSHAVGAHERHGEELAAVVVEEHDRIERGDGPYVRIAHRLRERPPATRGEPDGSNPLSVGRRKLPHRFDEDGHVSRLVLVVGPGGNRVGQPASGRDTRRYGDDVTVAGKVLGIALIDGWRAEAPEDQREPPLRCRCVPDRRGREFQQPPALVGRRVADELKVEERPLSSRGAVPDGIVKSCSVAISAT